MASVSCHSFVEWKEQFVSKEKGKRVVHYFLKDVSGESILSVVGTERSVRHMFYVVSEEFLSVHGAENSVYAGFRWRSKREVVNWLTSMLSKQHQQSASRTRTSLEMDPEMIRLFRRRMGVAEPIPALNPRTGASKPEKKRRRLTKAAEKEIAAEAPTPSSKPPSAPTQRPPKPLNAPTQGGGAPALEKGKEKVVEGSAPQGTREPHITRGKSGVHPGPITGVSIASLVAGKRPFQNELEAFEVYSPLVPATDFKHFARMSGEKLMKKVCHVVAQSHTIALGAAKKVLALEIELKNTHATLFQKNKEAASLANELKEIHAKIVALEAEAKESRALKEKVSALTKVNEDLGHQLKVKNEALKKASDAAKVAEGKAAEAVEVVKVEGERAVRAYVLSDDYQSTLDKAIEDFKTSIAGEQYLLDGIQKWQEGDDGKFFKVYNFNLGFEEFRKAAKNRYPKLDLSKVCMEDLFTEPAETTTGEEMSLAGDVEVGEEVSKPVEK